MTALKVGARAGNLAFLLPKKAKREILDMDPQELREGVDRNVGGDTVKVSGVKRLLEVLDAIYLEDLHKEKFKAYCGYRNFKRVKSQNVHDFLLNYEAKKRHLESHGITLPEEICAFDLLASVNLSSEQESLANCTVENLTYKAMKDTIKKIVSKTDDHSTASSSEIIKVVKEEPAYFLSEETSGQTGQEYEDNEKSHDDVYFNSQGGYRGRGRPRYRSDFQTRSPRRSQYNRYSRGSRGGGRQSRATNPRDTYGNFLTCHVCKSINHFANECPNNSQYYAETEHVTLFQNEKAEVSTSEDAMTQFTGDNLCLAVLDTGCNITVCGKEWLKVYLESLDESRLKEVKVEESGTRFKFGDNEPTVASQRYTIPATVCNKDLDIVTEVVNDNIPLLLSKRSMAAAKMVIDLGDNTVTAFGYTQKMLVTPSGHCSITLRKFSIHDDICLCSQDNVVLHAATYNDKNAKRVATKLHKQFGHPRASQLKTLVKMAGREDKELFKEIEKCTSSCDTCLRYKHPESRPIVCMPLAKEFNDTVSMDLKCFDVKNGIYFQHIIDHLTRFSMVKVIYSKDKEVIVESVFTHWISIFGRPKRFLSDNGGEYNNSHFIDMCEKFGVHVVTTGAESAWSNGLVERHHALLTRNVRKIIEDTGCRIETAVAWATNSKNILSNIDGYSPYQLVLGRNPNLPGLDDPDGAPTTYDDESPSEKVAEHIRALYSARKHQMEKDADEKIRRALTHKTRDVMSKDVSHGDRVYYKRDNSDRWKGPATVIGTDRKIVFLRQGGYQIKCHISRVVKVNEIHELKSDMVSDPQPMPVAERSNSRSQNICGEIITTEESTPSIDVTPHDRTESDEEAVDDPIKEQKLCDAKAKVEKKKLAVCILQTDPFAVEKAAELQKWVDNDVFEEVPISDIEEDVSPISVGWIYTDNEKKRKARLVARGYQEAPLMSTSTVSPTCRKESLRILFTVTASSGWTIKSVDITSAFLQGKEMDRTVYLIPPKEYKRKGVWWKLKKCVYGLSDAARMWYDMVKEQVTIAGIDKCPHDDAFFYWTEKEDIGGIMSIHVDDFVFSGGKQFTEKLENEVLKPFTVGSEEERQFDFLGLHVNQDEETKMIQVSQHHYILNELSPIQLMAKRKLQKNHALTSDEFSMFKSSVGKLLWLSTQTRPDIAYDVCQLSNHLAEPNVQDILMVNKLITKMKNEPEMMLCFHPINLKDTKLIVYADAAYGNLPRFGSQCGYMIFLTDSEGQNKNPIAWKSVKIDRVCQSALAAEGLALVKAIDHAVFIMKTLQKMMNNEEKIPIVCYTDNKSLHEVLLKTKDPEEKRLVCVLAPIRDSSLNRTWGNRNRAYYFKTNARRCFDQERC